jgi:ribosomal protein L37AE/L43A
MKPEQEDVRINLTADIDERDSIKDKVEQTDCPICRKNKLVVDISMALIQCDNCGISFEYRYRRGTVPYHTILFNRSSVLSEEQLIDNIKGILIYYDPSDSDDYLDEGKQSELNTLMNCLNRELSIEETDLIDKERKKYFGEKS